MAVYGPGHLYGTEFYGYDLPPQYRVDPFVATSINYTSVQVTWTAPAGSIAAYRLVKNRFGFPVDQDDGELLIDSLSFPGQQFIDTSVVPGTYQYYGFFVLLTTGTGNLPGTGNQVWVRSGWTACLAISNFSSAIQVNELIPDFYKGVPELSPVLPPEFPTTFLDFFCSVLGWGIDYLRTQYDTYLSVNDPWKVTIKDLYNMGTQFGININPDIHPYTLRKAIFFNAVVNQQRGTTTGLNQELEVLTGWAADLQVNENFMLENDQSAFTDPAFTAWSANISYNIGEFVSFGNFWYQCIATNNEGHSPTGANSSNTWWSPVVGVDNNTFINNLNTVGGLNTWELLNPGAGNGQPPASSFFEILGISNPNNAASFQYNGLDCYNKTGSTATLWVRSVSRQFATGTTPWAPNKDKVVGDGLPVPFVNNALVWNGTTWNPATRFGTDQIVTYNNVPFMALRASTNVQPPFATRASVNNEWAPVSFEPRFRICISAYLQASSSGMTAAPFVEWYDANGNFLTRVIGRNTTPGSNTLPPGLVYDAFTYPAAAGISSRTTDDGGFSWTLRAGTWHISPFSDGCVYPFSSSRSEATVNSGVSNCQVGVTFVTAAGAGNVQGLVLRWQDDNNYLRASMTELDLKQSGSFTTLGVYSSSAQPGDRLVAVLNGTSITIFINNVLVLSTTSSFNTSGTTHGIVNEGSVVVTNPGSQSNTVGVPI